jgi:FMN phosphatase YigB (HAD superfamily)
MALKRIKWVGIDFGQCLMSPSSLRNPHIFGDIGKLLGKQGMVPVWIDRMRRLKEKYKTYTILKEKHRDEIESFVFDNDREAYEIFKQKEQELLSMAPGVSEFLTWLNEEGIRPSIISELKKTLGPVGDDVITSFLITKGIIKHFKYFITPQGKVDLDTDERFYHYKGTSKESGTLYDQLMIDLKKKGIRPEECVMIGDKQITDIIPPKKRGFITIQYTGHVDEGLCGYSDYYAKTFFEVREIMEKV